LGQVPCGIYDDAAKIKELKQHSTTITKATNQINALSPALDAQALNQAVRESMPPFLPACRPVAVAAGLSLPACRCRPVAVAVAVAVAAAAAAGLSLSLCLLSLHLSVPLLHRLISVSSHGIYAVTISLPPSLSPSLSPYPDESTRCWLETT